jgi:2-iminobutanoate/2-iminopropanoate deaminase
MDGFERMRYVISDPGAAGNTGAYSPALRVGPWIFVSGQGPLRPDGSVIPGDIGVQTTATLHNIRTLVEAAGGRVEDIVKCDCFIANMQDFPAFDAAYRHFFHEPFPTRTTVEAGLDGILVEINAVALVEDER